MSAASAYMSSWWNKYFAPGDLRARQHALSASTDNGSVEKNERPAPPARINATDRARRQNALLFGGLAFTALSAFVTRRALVKKRIATYPHLASKIKSKNPKLDVPHFTQSNIAPKAEGGLDAAEALFLATLGVGSLFMAGTGGFMKYFDIADVEDLREFVRAGIGFDVYDGDSEADKEIEGWFAEVLSRKDGTGDFKSTIVQKMAELEELEKKRKAEQDAKKLSPTLDTLR